ncbi:hypothetical protein [Burkholderia pyrrocinia]|uniref:hypothetical protein n=1 Tax=Burkholderia pyrrocinia TaxID=60550 RepID=UPI001BCA8D9F|nr:hypothetical protein [Burkholderia pyrrocinia]QVN21766.1 hypothetical protein JYG32_20500 [Burkholderia pyrrocinia]
MSLPTLSANQVMIGNASGWALTFHQEENGKISQKQAPLTLCSADYEARLSATLPAGLEPGSCSITIEGMTDAHYAQIAQTGAASQPTVVQLYLYWVDANASPLGYLANLGGLTDTLGRFDPASMASSLVAVLRIVKVTRAVGVRRYEATIECKERVYQNLSTIRIAQPVGGTKLSEAVTTIGQRTGIDIKLQGFGAAGSMPASSGNPSGSPGASSSANSAASPGDEQVSIESGGTYATALADLATRMEHASGKYGRGLMLIRDGSLYFGVRQFPLAGDSKPLTLGSGLLAVETLDRVSADPDATPDSAKPAAGSATTSAATQATTPATTPAATRRQFKLTLKGRPDLKPGDMATFDSPAEEMVTQPSFLNALLGGAFAGSILPGMGADTIAHPINLYVTSVTHALGRATGFVTTVAGVEIVDLSRPWDTASGTGAHAPGRTTGTTGARSDGAASAVSAIRQAVREGAETPRSVDIGEVRGFHPSGDGTTEPPGQTERVFRGLVEPDGRANQARRLDIRRDSPAPIEGVSYASPFAWGKCGLVLPRYPGMRVVLAHRNGRAEDPVEVGALWTSGHGPTSQAGDYWLILPVGVDQASRSQVADTATPAEYAGKVTNDLIDADGNRVIEVGELTLRVGSDHLKNAGERPARPADQGSVTIEHASGQSSIVMKQDGSVIITAKNITLDAGTGTITMKANSVDVQVQSNMNVH